jgi:protease I
MAAQLHDQRIAIMATHGVERIELEQPRGALHAAGAKTDVVSIQLGEISARERDLYPAGTIAVDRVVSDVSVDDYEALLLPGGTVNPDKLRMNRDVIAFVRVFVETGKPVAAICHGPWSLVEADVVRGRTLTSWPSIRTDLRNAGAEVVDEEVVVDKQFTTSRSPADLPAFCPAIVEQFANVNAPGWGSRPSPSPFGRASSPARTAELSARAPFLTPRARGHRPHDLEHAVREQLYPGGSTRGVDESR